MAPILNVAEGDAITDDAPPPPSRLIPPKTEPKTAIEEDEDTKAEKAEKGGGYNMSPTLLKLKNAAEMDTKAWLDSISGETALKVKLIRKEPKTHRDPETGDMVKVDGTIQNYDRTIDEDEIQKTHGGGTFQLVIQTKNNKGQWGYFAAKTIEIAGDPNIKSVPRTHVPLARDQVVTPQKDPTEGKLLDKTFGFMMDEMRLQRTQPPPAPVSTGLSTDTMMAIIKPLEIQITALTAQLAAAQAETAHVRETAGKDPFRDKLLSTMMDTESTRISHLRMMHESEIKQLKEGFVQDLKRAEDRALRDIERIEKAHDREMAAVKAANEQAILMAGQKADMTKLVLDGQNKQLEKHADRLETELTTLRAKKEQSIKEKVDELQAIKDLVGDDDDEESTKLEQIIGAVGGLPVVQRLAERMAGGQTPAQQQAQQQPQKPTLVRDKETGEVGLRKPSGEIVPVKKRPVQVATADGTQVEIPSLDPAQVKQAVTYMEGAYRNGTDPVMFASTARPFVNDSMMGVIRTLGISEFLTKVGKIDGSSVLATMRGRQWAKKVAAALMGEDDQPAAEPAATPDATPQPEG